MKEVTKRSVAQDYFEYITCLGLMTWYVNNNVNSNVKFLFYINDFPNCLDFSKTRLYADDTSLTFSDTGIPYLNEQIHNDLKHVVAWLSANKLTLNVLKSEFMLIGSRQRLSTLEGDISLSINSKNLKRIRPKPNV